MTDLQDGGDGGDDHGDRAIYCEGAERYLLGRTPDGECPFCGTDLTGERYERLQDRVEELDQDDDEFVTDGGVDQPDGGIDRSGDDRTHPNARINRHLKHPPIAGAKLDTYPEVRAEVYTAVRPAFCRVCDYPASFVITLPGDAVPLCKKHAGGERGVRDL